MRTQPRKVRVEKTIAEIIRAIPVPPVLAETQERFGALRAEIHNLEIRRDAAASTGCLGGPLATVDAGTIEDLAVARRLYHATVRELQDLAVEVAQAEQAVKTLKAEHRALIVHATGARRLAAVKRVESGFERMIEAVRELDEIDQAAVKTGAIPRPRINATALRALFKKIVQDITAGDNKGEYRAA